MTEVRVACNNSSGGAQLTPEEERVLIRDIAIASETKSKEGDSFYLITQRWWQHWIDYVNQDQTNVTNDGSSMLENCDTVSSSKRPASIDNSDLIYDVNSEESNVGIEIHDTLLEGRDYVLLPQEVWNQLYSWYGGGPALARKVISSGLSQTEFAVEVYPLRLQLLVMPKGDRCAVRISKKETIGELHKRACEIFYLNLEQVCIWDYYGHHKHALMNDMDKTLDDANLQMDQDILVEVHEIANGTALSRFIRSAQDNGPTVKDASSFHLEPSKSSLSIAGGLPASKGASRGYSAELSQSPNLISQGPNLTYQGRELDNACGTSTVTTRGSSGGLIGLQNLGNTCFMNSAIQCLVHTSEFAEYFREDYHQEINWKNPLGMVGELALAFGELLRRLWAPGRTAIAPRQFKMKLARFAPQFSGYNQHDSQELLAFLLDGLHEDLNRVKHKPYKKSKDADGRPDEEVADEYWASHIARNDSIIVDVCQGQYKSTLVCPECNKISVTFDPFMYLSLPLQSTTTRSMTVTVFTCDGSALPFACTVTVPKQGRCRDLINALGCACSLKNSEELKLAEVRNHLFQRFLEDPLISLSTIKDDDHLAAYKIAKSLKKTLLLRLIHRCQEQETGDTKAAQKLKPFGMPLVSLISHDDIITRGDIQQVVHTMLSPLLRSESLRQADIPEPSSSLAASDMCHNGSSDEACTNPVSDSMNKDSSGSRAVTLFKLPLQLVEESNACIDLSVGEDKTIKLSSTSTSMLVYVDWSQELLEKYDIHYLENLPEVFKYGAVNKKARAEPLSLYTCLEGFLREEPLVPEDMWYCPKCKERRQASKKLDLWRLPEVLVIHLKRFSFSRSMKHKLETFVNFPIRDFDLTNYIANKNNTQRQLYELYALTNHYGGMGSGHYTAHIKLLDENRWYNFDDAHISPINEEDVKSPAAYVLFYRRAKTGDAISNGENSGTGHNNGSSLK
ncbi:PREDICTED: ubiquitin carboxyl-terminal hydrolase 5 isoform X2 [Populus euphratica]|uniref:Ubiquitin carboxyl-terminal hydrolase n=1 Tax=Populus euphratica TaxID=75702 RepID=A0AAJ6V549_POPEU|nr:PREDICTED: ubiquitin carboxyl-terminal hydrolase 5 isoform X2 [Populus euphratica]